jgi:hypothetical protein
LVQGENRTWWILTVAMLALGINKQLDLQTALTEIGRMMAHSEGWYEVRHTVQFAFIVVIGILALATIALLVWMVRRAPPPTRLAVAGCVVLAGFILIRASSFHHVDFLLSSRWAGMKVNWLLEMGGISILIGASQWRIGYRS